MDWELMGTRLAQTILASRDDVVRYVDEAQRNGKRRQAASWRSRLRKLDQRIALYGLDRYAPRP
jgi:hypothetical protein